MRYAMILGVLLAAAGCGGSDDSSGDGCWAGSPNFDPSDYSGVCFANPDAEIRRYCVTDEQVLGGKPRSYIDDSGLKERCDPVVILAPYATQDGEPAGYGVMPKCGPCPGDSELNPPPQS